LPIRPAAFAPSPSVGRYSLDPQVVAAVRNASASSGTRFDTLLASAALESGLNATAQASTSSARGLFQFTEQTWLSAVHQFGAAHGLQTDAAAIVSQHGQLTVVDPAEKQRILNLRFDPSVSANMAGAHLRDLAVNLATAIGHPPDAAETYMAHFLGSAGATQMLQAAASTPGRSAASVLPEAARANRSAFGVANGASLTAEQFVQHLRARVAQAFSDVGSTMPQGPLAFSASGTVAGSSDTAGGLAIARSSTTPPERIMAASLVDVFTRLDRKEVSSQTGHGKRDHMLPLGLVSALASATTLDAPDASPGAASGV
jgi:hypothetical protein